MTPDTPSTLGEAQEQALTHRVSKSLDQLALFLVARNVILYTRIRRGVMANAEQLEIIIEDGVHRWNAWRAENPKTLTDIAGVDLVNAYLREANLENTNLQNADLKSADLANANLASANLANSDLTGADLMRANLTATNLANAKLIGATLTRANLAGADLAGADLTGANLTEANLIDANFRSVNLVNAIFKNAKLSKNTLGLGRLPTKQRADIQLVDVAPAPEDTPQEAEHQISDNAHNLTVGYARSIVGPAHWALQGLSIPNDLSEEHRNLFEEMLGIVAELEQKLSNVEGEQRLLSSENETLRNSIGQAVPLWKRAWEEFILKGAGAVGDSAGKASVFAAGFIAGTLYTNFAPAAGVSV